MNNWVIVTSKSDKHPVFGYPMGQVLCRNMQEANDFILKSQFKDCSIQNYIDTSKTFTVINNE